MSTTQTDRRLPLSDIVISLLFVALFAWAYLEAGQWTFRSALFPKLVTAAGALIALLRLAMLLLRRRRSTVDDAARPQIDGVTVVDDEEAEEQSLEYVFANAGRRVWLESLGWVLLFFGGLYVLGLYVTVPVFTVAYLRFVGRTPWWVAAVYAAVATLILYLAFTQFLRVPVPSGTFG
ncbi:MAG: hypothetical protein GEU74_04955 [Nitriliruptorales bacterium]|nr:hypothetical protein [Nitriliruptorales bacterium]